MIDIPNYFSNNDSCMSYPIVKPNLITGEGRAKPRPWSAYKTGGQKKESTSQDGKEKSES